MIYVHGIFLCLFSCVYRAGDPAREKWEGVIFELSFIERSYVYIDDSVLIKFSTHPLMHSLFGVDYIFL